MESSILVTGSTGQVGTALPLGGIALKTRLEQSADEMRAEIKGLNVGPYALIHLAGLVLVAECEKDPARCRALNVDGAKNWFVAAAESGCAHFVYVSTAHIYAPPQGTEKLTINSPVGPRSEYAKSKLEAEQELTQLQKKYPGTKLTIARVFSILSPSMRKGFLLTGLTERAQNKDFSPIPGLDNVRDFITTEALGKELFRLTRTKDAPQIINLCTGKGTSVRELAENVFRDHGLDGRVLTAAPGRADDIPYIVGEPTPF